MSKTEFDCSAIDRRTKVKRHTGATTIDWVTAYDDATNTRTETDPLNKSTSHQHDALDRLRYVKWTENGSNYQTEFGLRRACVPGPACKTDNRTKQLDATGNQNCVW